MVTPSEQGRSTSERKETLEGKTPVLIAGLPGKMATLVTKAINRSEDFTLPNICLSSDRHPLISIGENDEERLLYAIPSYRPRDSIKLKSHLHSGLIAVDFTTPQAVNKNAELYAEMGIPFVMGTTGGNRQKLVETVKNSEISAVIAPNMAVEVVRIQHAIETLAQNAPGVFKDWRMEIKESHQASKKDVSGTAKALQAQLEQLGAVMEEDIISIRDLKIQEELGIKNLSGHAYHWITLQSPDGVSTLSFRTKIEGRQPYVNGTMVALKFLQEKIRAGSKGEVFSMVDVLRAQTGAK
ncbi:MAG: dihydrodipicolinate reductase C-terminal domain-containing protein [bacterium]|nr:dihydrodipicolinate reductase C-terminal domain-containing protein [bacterium]